MRDVVGARVVAVAHGFVKGRYKGWVYWGESRSAKTPDLTDDSTLDVLWGQLRRRFAACAVSWDGGVASLVALLAPTHQFDALDDEFDILLAGYRRVVELEREVGDGE